MSSSSSATTADNAPGSDAAAAAGSANESPAAALTATATDSEASTSSSAASSSREVIYADLQPTKAAAADVAGTTAASTSRETICADIRAKKPIPCTGPRAPVFGIADASAFLRESIFIVSDTVKKDPTSEITQADLLRLLSYLEGELQAREIVIAALKSESIKQHIYATRGIIVGDHDPQAALYRDSIATSSGHQVSRASSALAAQSELAIRSFARQKLDALQNVIYEQRHAHIKLIGVLKDFEEKHKSLLQQLADEKQKHERDTAQGDDITYGLEVERTRLRVDLETERALTKRLEKEAKKTQETLDAERSRQKTIVLLLLAERKRIIMKYMEERKRSEDLAQILAEEKQRVDSISEGLEEESKKSLRMEAELETQQQAFDVERKQYAAQLAGCEVKVRDQEQELLQLRHELQRKQQQIEAMQQQQRMQLPPKGMAVRASFDATGDDGAAASSPLMSSVTKVVQPTATVSSVPVSGPTTGIARSISPGQTMRAANEPPSTFNAVKVVPRKLSNVGVHQPPPSVPHAAAGPSSATSVPVAAAQVPQLAGKLNAAAAAAAAAAGATAAGSHSMSTIKKTPAALPLGRGVPPPIPPNKPVVPPKREPSVTRMGSIVAQTAQQLVQAAAAAAAGVAPPASPIATGVAVATSGTTEDII